MQQNLGDEKVDGAILAVGFQTQNPNKGKMVICGQFQHVLGVAWNRVARFNPDMTLDTTFDIGSGANEMVSDLIVQGDDKIVLAGNFDSFNGTAAGYLARLTPDGALDPTFNVDSWWQSGSVYAILRQATGKAILGGDIYIYYSPAYYTTTIPRVFASSENSNEGSLSLLLLSD